MVGRNPGYVSTPGEILSDHFEARGYRVISVSSSPNRYMRLADIVANLIRHRHSIDIMALQVYGARSFVVEDIASWLGRRFGHRVVMVLHGGAMSDFMSCFPAWTRRVLGRAHALIAPSEFLARAIIPYGFKAKVIPNSIDLTVYPYRHRRIVKPRLFWMRSFHPVYNPEMAVRVLASVRKSIKDAILVIAGQDKGEQSTVQRLANKLELDGAVWFPGYLNMADKIREGNAADIFLNTNRVDNTPVSVIEACAMGLPVIATNVGGISDLLTDNETALLVPDNDDRGMAAAVLRLLHEPDLAGRLSANGRKLAESFSWEHVRPQWEQLFAGLMDQSPEKGEL